MDTGWTWGNEGSTGFEDRRVPAPTHTTAALPATPSRPRVRQQPQTGRPRKDHTALQAWSPLGPRGLAVFWAPVVVLGHGQRTHGRGQGCTQGRGRAGHCGGCRMGPEGTGPLLSAQLSSLEQLSLLPSAAGACALGPGSWLPSTTLTRGRQNPEFFRSSSKRKL